MNKRALLRSQRLHLFRRGLEEGYVGAASPSGYEWWQRGYAARRRLQTEGVIPIPTYRS